MNTVIIEVNEKTAGDLALFARARAVAPSTLAEEAIRAFLRSETQRAMEQEAQTFLELHAQLITTIPGEYAAIHGGQLIDHDPDQLALAARMEARFGGLPVLIRQVRPTVDQTLVVRSPRIEYE